MKKDETKVSSFYVKFHLFMKSNFINNLLFFGKQQEKFNLIFIKIDFVVFFEKIKSIKISTHTQIWNFF